MRTEFICSQCHEHKINDSDFTTGYGTDNEGNKVCYSCCGLNDAKELNEMKPKDKTIQYWNGKELTNWPGTLKIKPYYTKKGGHNIAGTREDIYFMFNGNAFHGVTYGSNTQICHITRLINK